MLFNNGLLVIPMTAEGTSPMVNDKEKGDDEHYFHPESAELRFIRFEKALQSGENGFIFTSSKYLLINFVCQQRQMRRR